MAYRRKQGGARDSTFKEEFGRPRRPIATPDASSSASAASSLAAKAIRASSAYRDSSLSSAYGQSAISPREPSDPGTHSPSITKDSTTYEYTSLSSSSESKPRFWRVLARKAKAVLDDDDAAKRFETPGSTRLQMFDAASKSQSNNPYLPENQRKKDSPALQKGLGSIASSLNYIGSSIGNALEEGLAIMENRTTDIIQETRKLQVRKKDSQVQSQASNFPGGRQPPAMQPLMETDLEIQLKASRDVAMAMAAKAKLLLRELKTVKADLAFAKERCAQLEEENRVLRESHEKGDSPEDDDLIRLQLETLLAEKARLAQENSVFARENRFLREIVEYHQLTMQDVVYLDENSEEVSEVYPIRVSSATNPHSMGTKSSPPPEETCTRSPLAT